MATAAGKRGASVTSQSQKCGYPFSKRRCTCTLPRKEGHKIPMHIQAVDNSDIHEDAQEVTSHQGKF